MNYLCKDCIYNNNGWCKKRKIQKLKEVKECEFKGVEEKNNFEDKSSLEKVSEEKNESYKNFGKRELFYNIQRQISALEMKGEKSISIEDLKKLMIGIEQTLKISENINGISLDFMIDEDIFKHSVDIIKKWKKETEL